MGGLFLHARKLIVRCFPSFHSRQFHVCIVGSGPAGFFTANLMLKTFGSARVDILDRLPTPFGFLRFGVEPYDPEAKPLVDFFSRVAANERCSFFGNVSLGTNVSLSELREIYDAVVLAYGAESGRSLGILGEGNIALDVARILLQPATKLETTDIPENALVSLRESTIRKVYIVGRRGPLQAPCLPMQLHETLGIKDLCVHIQEADLLTSSADEEGLKTDQIQRRVYDLFSKAAKSKHSHALAGQRELHFLFFRKPDRFLPSYDGSHVSGVRFEKTCLKENGGWGPYGKQLGVGIGQYEDLECGLVLKGIGNKPVQVDGLPLPFDKHGVIPNIGGRVLSCDRLEDELPDCGLYVTGVLKRGYIGTLTENIWCARETAGSIQADCEDGFLVPTGSPKPGKQGLLQLLDNKNIKFVPFSGWKKIDSKERMEGLKRNKPRERITSWEDLLKVANE